MPDQHHSNSRLDGRAACLRIIRHHSPLGHWEAVYRRPDPRLADLIQGEYQGWVEHEASFTRRREIAAAIIPLILTLGPAFRINGPGHREGPGELFGSFVAGLHESFTLVESTGPSRCLQVNFSPLGAYLVFGVSMASLTNRCVGLDDLLGKDADRLVGQLHDARGWEACFEILDAFLLGRLESARPASAGVLWAWSRLVETGGGVPIRSLTKGLGCSHRHMIAQFREQLGSSPKMVARILRFQRVAAELERGEDCRWAEVAQQCGYYDQAHLIRDFGEFAGVSPGEFLRQRLPDGLGVVGD